MHRYKRFEQDPLWILPDTTAPSSGSSRRGKRMEEFQRPSTYHAWYCRQQLRETAAETATSDPTPAGSSGALLPLGTGTGNETGAEAEGEDVHGGSEREDSAAEATSTKQRCPAWTDRILWRDSYKATAVNANANASANAKDTGAAPHRCTTVQHSYTRLPHVYGSDHKPVRATFTVSIRAINARAEYEVYKEVRRAAKRAHKRRMSRASDSSSLSMPSYRPADAGAGAGAAEEEEEEASVFSSLWKYVPTLPSLPGTPAPTAPPTWTSVGSVREAPSYAEGSTRAPLSPESIAAIVAGEDDSGADTDTDADADAI